MKNSIFGITLLASIILMCQCSSPLSDVAISDPNLVTPEFVLRSTNTDYGISSSISVCLRDKNGAYIKLKEGKVMVNQQDMDFKISCYGSNLSVSSGKKYKFDVVLADSNAYAADVVVPSFFEKVKIPSKINQSENISVSWENNYSNSTTKVVFEIKDTSNFWRPLFEEDVNNTSSITIQNIDYPDYKVSEGKITLSRIVSGNVSNEFSGGNIDAYVIYERTLKIK